MPDGKLRQVKERLTALNKMEWHFLDGKNGILIYSDRREVEISRTELVNNAILNSANAKSPYLGIQQRIEPGFKWWVLVLFGVTALYRSILINRHFSHLKFIHSPVIKKVFFTVIALISLKVMSNFRYLVLPKK